MENIEKQTEPTRDASITNQKASEENNVPGEKTLSKNQLKKQAKLAKALIYKPIKRKLEREKRRKNGKNNLCIIEKINGDIVNITRKSLKKNLMSESKNKLRICIDCSFENLMSFSDIRHLGKQLAFCYGANRRMESPLQLFITSMAGKTKELLEKSGLSNWDIQLKDKHFLEEFCNEQKENLCYLTSDSPNELTEFDDKKIYIIGGLVDHNHHKSICYDIALKNNLMHYRLPINKFMEMKTRPVLTINQVYDIICKFTECNDWLKAFQSTLPKRKGAQPQQQETEETNKKEEIESSPEQNEKDKIKAT